jgi:anti-sigma B factor antagonist
MSTPILKITESKMGSVIVLTLSGELDAKTAPDFRTQLDAYIAAGSSKIVCDCKNLTYVASAGIGVMNAVLKAAAAKSGELKLASVTKDILDTMELMYFTKKVKIYGTVEEAVQSFK